MATQIGQLKYSIGFDVKKQDLNTLKAQLQQISKLKISDVMKINNTDRDKATQILNDIQKQAKKVEDALKAAFNVKLNTVNIEAFNKSLQGADTSLQKIHNTFKQSGVAGENAFRNLVTQVTTSNMQLKETHKFLDNIATTLGNTIKWNVASSAINSLSGSIQQAWGYVKSLDNSLNDIRIVTGKSADEMAKFSKQANEAAISLGKTTVDYTKAALIYAQQGLSDEDIATRAAITLKTANVTGQSTDAVSEQLTSVWNGYKVNAEQAELYIDRLAAVAATTASDLEELSTGMSKVAAAAAAMGVGEDQLAAQLSTIISVTRQAPESVGTALRTVYARISDIKAGIDEDGVTLGNYSGKMAELGFNVLDVNGKLRDMGQVIEDIGGRWQNLTREQQVSLAQTMAGQRQYSNLIALFDNFDKYTQALHTAQNAAGTLQKQQDIYMDSTQAHLNRLKTATEDLYDSLVNADSIKPLISGLTTATSLVAKFVDALGGGGNVLISLGGIAANVFSKQLTKGVQTFVHNIQVASANTKDLQMRIDMLQQAQARSTFAQEKALFANQAEKMKAVVPTATEEQYAQLTQHIKNATAAFNQYDAVMKQIDDSKNQEKFVKVTHELGEEFKKLIIDKDGQEKQNELFDQLWKNSDKQEKKNIELSNSLNDYNKQLKLQQDYQKQLNLQLNAKVQTDENQKILEERKKEAIKETNKILQEQINLLKNSEGYDQNKKDINELIAVLQKLKDGFNSEDYESAIKKVQDALHKSTEKTKKDLEDLGKQMDKLREGYQGASSKKDQANNNFNNWFSNFASQKNIQNIGKMVGGFTQLGAAINQASNAGTLFAQGKIGQGIANVGTSLATISTGALSAARAMQGLGIAANLSLGILTGGIAIAAAAASAIIGIVKAKQAQLEATIELNKERIEQQNKIQEQFQNNKKLYSSIEDLNKQYKQGQINRTQLKSSIEDLIDKYGLERDSVQELTKDYDNLTESIKKRRQAELRGAISSATTEYNAAKSEVVNTAKGGLLDRGRQSGNRFLYDFGYATGLGGQAGRIQEILKTIGGLQEDRDGYLRFDIEINAQSIKKQYDAIQAAVNKIYASGFSDSQLASNNLLKIANEFLTQMSQSIDHLNNSQKDRLKYQSELNILQSTDLNNIKTTNDYLIQRNNIINAIQRALNLQGDKVSNAQELADQYLRDNYRSLFNQFDQRGEYTRLLQQKFKNIVSSDKITKEIDNLSQNVFGKLVDYIDLDNINSWNQLLSIIQKLSQIDLSNVAAVTAQGSTLNAATDNYTFYQGLEDQIKSGKSISKSEFGKLENSGLQEYFSAMANGQYKLVGDAEQFYNKVNSLKLSGFISAIDEINRKLESTENLAKGNFNYNQLNKNAYTQRSSTILDRKGHTIFDEGNVDTFNEDLYKKQLQYLKLLSNEHQGLAEKIIDWEAALEESSNGANRLSKLKDASLEIANAIKDVGDQTQDTNEKIKNFTDQLQQANQALYDALFPTDSDINESELFGLTQLIKEIADDNNEFEESLNEDARAAENVAQEILRFNNAIEDLVKNYETWHGVLTNENVTIQQLATIMQPLRDAYADLLAIDGSSLSADFLQDTINLQLMKAAIDGNIESYDQLRALAAQDIITHINFDTTQTAAQFNEIYNDIASWIKDNKFDLKFGIGAQLTGQEALMNSLNELINATQMTAAQASDLLHSAFGIDAEVINETQPVESEQTFTGMSTNVNVRRIRTKNPLVGDDGEIIFPDIIYEPEEVKVKNTQMVTGTALKIINAKKASGGQIKWKHSAQGAGHTGVTRRKLEAEKASKSTTSLSTKQSTKYQKDDRDIYRGINTELSQVNRELSRAQKQQSNLSGKPLIDNLNKQYKILEKQKDVLVRKNELQKWDLEQKKQQLKLMGAELDLQGHITNYMDLMGSKINTINGYIQQQNALIAQYNAASDKQAQDAIGKQITEVQRMRKQAEDQKKQLETVIKNYDTIVKSIQDVADQVTELTRKQIEINLNKIEATIKVSVDLRELQKELIQFNRKVVNADNLFKDSVFTIGNKDANEINQILKSYFDVDSHNSIQILKKVIEDNKPQLQQITQLLNTGAVEYDDLIPGSEETYGDRASRLLQVVQEAQQKLDQSLTEIRQYEQQLQQIYIDTIDNVGSEANRQIDQYQYVGNLLQHDIDLLKIMYGDQQYDAMDSYYNQMLDNHYKELDFLKMQAQYYQHQMDAERLAGNENLARKWEQLWKDAISKVRSEYQDFIKQAQQQFINSINKTYDELDKSLTGGRGLDYIQMEWELIKRDEDRYLDDINAVYSIQQLERKYKEAIDNSKANVKTQKVLTDLMNQQLKSLRDKEKLSKYDVERAEKLLNIEQARMALEDVRNAKTSLRLKRDSQGNYSYVYTANQNDIDDADAKLAQLENDLYNFDKEEYRRNLDNTLSIYRQYLEKRKEIQLEYGTNLTEQQKREKEEKLALIDKYYLEWITDETRDNLEIRENLTRSATQAFISQYEYNAQNFGNRLDDMDGSVDELIDKIKNKQLPGSVLYGQLDSSIAKVATDLMPELISYWDSNIQSMINTFADESDENSFKKKCETAWAKVGEAAGNYESKVRQVQTDIGPLLASLEDGVDNITKKYTDPESGLIKANEDLNTKLQSQIDLIGSLIDSETGLPKVTSQYQDLFKEAATAVEEAKKAIKDWYQLQSKISQTKLELVVPENPSGNNSNVETPNSLNSFGTPSNPAPNLGSSVGQTPKSDSGDNVVAASSKNTNKVPPSQSLIDNLTSAVAGGWWGGYLPNSTQGYQSLRQLFAQYLPEQLRQGYSTDEILYWVSQALQRDGYERYLNKSNLLNYVKYSLPYLEAAKAGAQPKTEEALREYVKQLLKNRNKIGRTVKFDTGGYTGEWGPSGRLAMLHQKQLVLNATDTKNILNSVSIIRDMVSGLNSNIFNRLNGLNGGYSRSIASQIGGQIDQNVSIQASFPNVNSKKEIEDAFNELVNLAAQRAMRR